MKWNKSCMVRGWLGIYEGTRRPFLKPVFNPVPSWLRSARGFYFCEEATRHKAD
jgi:hypothetical protein